MNDLSYNTPKVQKSISNVKYTISTLAKKGSNYINLDRKIERSFEIGEINGKIYLITSSIRKANNVIFNEIYPALDSDVPNGYVIKILHYNRDNNDLILSTEQNYDLLSRFMILTEQVKNLYKELNYIDIEKPADLYELAVRQGFTGTLDEFILSFKGKDGISPNPNLYVLTELFNREINSLDTKIEELESIINNIDTSIKGWRNGEAFKLNEICYVKVTVNGLESMALFQSTIDDNIDIDPMSNSDSWINLSKVPKIKYKTSASYSTFDILINNSIRTIIGNDPIITAWMGDVYVPSVEASRVIVDGKLTKITIMNTGRVLDVMLS